MILQKSQLMNTSLLNDRWFKAKANIEVASLNCGKARFLAFFGGKTNQYQEHIGILLEYFR